MKINKIKIKNFKVFTSFNVDFDSSDTIVLDGPNGFGKTTIYDAVELVFTGKIRRYSDLKAKLIDGRQTFIENPFHNDNAQGEDILIAIEFTQNSTKYVLERVAKAEAINGVLDFSIYKLYTKTNIASEERTLVENEETFLTDLFGKNYESNFQFLNYVEQEESLFLLKCSDKTRKSHIGHLFDLKEFEAKIKRIDDLKRRIDALCNSGKKNEIDILSAEIGQLRLNVSNDVTVLEYNRLFDKKDLAWDENNVDVNTISYEDICGISGVLERLKVMLERKDLFRQQRINSGVNYILENELLVKNFLAFYNFLSRKDEFRNLKTENATLEGIILQLNNVSSSNLDTNVELGPHRFILSTTKDRFAKAKEDLLRDLQELSGLDKIYADISASRDQLKGKLLALKESGDTTGECLLCGFDWGSVDELIKQIESKSQLLKEINSEKSSRFNESLSLFKSGAVQDLVNSITVRVMELANDVSFADELLRIEINQFNSLLKTFEFLKFDYSSFLNNDQSASASNSFDNLKTEISSLKNDIDEALIEPYFSDYFRQYFDNNIETLDVILLENIEKKKNYLNYLWRLNQNELLKTKTDFLNDKTTGYNDAREASGKLNQLKNVYRSSLTAYQKKIIKDIEVIFHIYSGRIMQSFQGGLGLFIFSEKDGIRFQSNPRKTYDAVFSMSSGQLSALIISFTLALHKKYSQNKIILIDDPVQTMDELNMYGFIDLLRNEFGGDQIIMSTHEDMMSSFMRYKFKNYNLSEKRINLKSLLQN